MNKNHLAIRLKALRTQKRMSQEVLAEALRKALPWSIQALGQWNGSWPLWVRLQGQCWCVHGWLHESLPQSKSSWFGRIILKRKHILCGRFCSALLGQWSLDDEMHWQWHFYIAALAGGIRPPSGLFWRQSCFCVCHIRTSSIFCVDEQCPTIFLSAQKG